MEAVDLYDGNDADDTYVADIDGEVDESEDVDVEFLCELCDESGSDLDNHAPEVFVVGSPLCTDDDRRSGPAEQDHQSQGGPEESKHFEIVDDEFPTFLPEVIDKARTGFARFWGLPVESVDATLIVELCPALGIAGW